MDSFQIKGIHFCVSDHHQAKEARNQVLQDSVSQNKVKAIVQEIEGLENQNPFWYSDLAIYLNIDEIHITGGLIDHSQNVSIVNQQVRITKHVYFKNLINKELMITNIFTSSPLLKVDFEKIVLPSNSTTQKTKVCTMIYEQPLSEIRSKTFEIWLAVEIAYFLRVPVKLIVYDKHLMCQTKLLGQCSVQGQHSTVEFNNLGIYQQYTKIFSFYNPNPVKIDVSYKQNERKKNQIRVLLANRNDIKSASKRKFSFEMQPYTRTELKVIINTNYYEILSNSKLTFRTQYEIIEVDVTYSVQKGSVNYYPSVITLDPGMTTKVQQFDIYVRSTFSQKIQLLQVENQQIKHQNISLLTMATNIATNSRSDILHVDYMGKQNFYSDSKYHKQQAKELLNSFGRNKIKIQTDVLQDSEILINYKSNQKFNEQILKKIIKQDPKILISQQTVVMSEQPNIFFIVISILNMLYIATLLRNNVVKSKELKITIDSNFSQEQIDFQSIFKTPECIQLQSKSETNEVVSDKADEIQDMIIAEDIMSKENIIYTNLQSQIDESSSHFSQGESLDDDQISEYQEKVVEQKKVPNQKNFNLFQRVEFTIPTQLTMNTQSSQECWDTKDPIFLPQDSDEEMLDKNSVQRLESMLNQIQHKLPQFEQSTLKLPLKWNENNQINPYFPKPPPGI
ncbi:unnamed protein product (macronuclear) [Paramecium tetraurelia]|uniref:Arrestin C-terminal-like domain-containing protein n=1 Tax=Paramecium tetraurelia TaxID=5888 RepID=A0CAB4_PARTE|nr:uncharacterized protein GSPATT00036511001 [Paramecium tetraurelia]CAK67731.1 unnamed protein product [Paramecium tetraurelia]|eukprot:XP_001435128.1 hypothetical protein (macronuclear) [Paramecium tetraurelia strain d4-2]